MPKGKRKVQSTDGLVNKMEVMRQALAKLGSDAKPLDLQKFVLQQFGVKMTTQMISTYKSAITRKGELASASSAKTKAKAAAHANNAVNLEDIEAVKELADRIGADKLKRLADVLGK